MARNDFSLDPKFDVQCLVEHWLHSLTFWYIKNIIPNIPAKTATIFGASGIAGNNLNIAHVRKPEIQSIAITYRPRKNSTKMLS